MNVLTLAQFAIVEAFAMDGDENAVQNSGWLQAHDDRFHNPNHEEHGHFDPQTMTCGLRQKLASADNSDMLEGAGTNLASIPTRQQFDGLLDRLQASGLIDADIRDDISRMVRSAESMMSRGDEENFELTGEDRENLKAIAEVYQALHAMETPDAAGSSEQPQDPVNVGNGNGHSPFSQNGGQLPNDNPLWNFAFTPDTMYRHVREVGGMPYNFTHVSQVTPERLAVLTSQLPMRGIFDHRDGTVDVSGVGRRLAGGESIRSMLLNPSSPLGREMRRRLAEWQRNHANDNSSAARAVRRLDQALSLLHPEDGSGNREGNTQESTANRGSFPGISAQTQRANMDNARQYGLEGTFRGHQLQLLRGLASGCNCWKCAASDFLRARGFDVVARSEYDNSAGRGTQNTSEFKKSQLACSEHYENIAGMSEEETKAKLVHIANDNENYPEGTALLLWSGGHGTVAFKRGHAFVHIDAWDSDGSERIFGPTELIRGYKPGHLGTRSPIALKSDTSGEYAHRANEYFNGNRALRHRVGQILAKQESERTPEERSVLNSMVPGTQVTLAEAREMQMLWLAAEQSLREKTHGARPSQYDIMQEVNNNRDCAYWRINGSYVIKPDDPIIPELFMLARSR